MSAAVDDFLRNVLKSGLFGRDQLQEAVRALPAQRREQPTHVADHLIRAGLLTPFQAQRLLEGSTGGLILGPFQLQAPLGRGGMGMVYLALDTRRQQHVALKILLPRKARGEERHLARFIREMELSRRVSHPNVALTLDAGVNRGIYYIALEYIPGETLYRLVTTTGPLPVGRAARLFAEIASGLHHAHSLGLVHRDLKPSNLMVTPHDHAKVLDLGLAFSVGEQVAVPEVAGGKGYLLGSIDYMAPEQAADASAVDARADLYALGCCLYFALTGRPPFPAGSMRDKVHAHRHVEPTLLQNRNPDVPGAFALLVHRLLAKTPAQRFGSAAELEVALKPWCQAWNEAPVETQGDSVFQESVRHIVQKWPADDLASLNSDGLVFDPLPDETAVAVNPNLSSYNEAEDRRRIYWGIGLTIGGMALFLGLLLLLLRLLFS
jgi:eukaryotic-like serine/threonine-protein kinase